MGQGARREFVTIGERAEREAVVKKSRFICALTPVETWEQAADELAKIRKKHYNATHNCYAAILRQDGSFQKASDDGEPQGTAGLPMLEVLQKNGLTNLLAVVTRYFGGTLLGAGGLARAYGGGVADALKCVEKMRRVPAIEYAFTVGYADYGKLCGIAAEYGAQPQGIFEDAVRARLVIEETCADRFLARVNEAFLGADVCRAAGECHVEKRLG